MRDWDERYRRGDFTSLEPNPLLLRALDGLERGLALDLACGARRHALVLAEKGWRVTAVDASRVGIGLVRDRARDRGLEINARTIDLEQGSFDFGKERYDLICDFYYLQRELFAGIRDGLKSGGRFVGAIHLVDIDPENTAAKPSFSLKEGELLDYFAEWEIVYYHETAGIDPDAGQHHKRTAELIARKTSLTKP